MYIEIYIFSTKNTIMHISEDKIYKYLVSYCMNK